MFPPTILKDTANNAISLVQKSHPDYVLAIDHITEYYDMKLANFGVDSSGNMAIAFPIFVKDHTSETKTKSPYLTKTKLQIAIQRSNTVDHT